LWEGLNAAARVEESGALNKEDFFLLAWWEMFSNFWLISWLVG
jgi:hypothetical protein